MATSDRLEAFSTELLRYFRSGSWTQASLAEALLTDEEIKVTASAVGEWCRGESEPSRDKVFALERIFRADPGALTRPLGYEPANVVMHADLGGLSSGDPGTDLHSRVARLPDHAQKFIQDYIDAEERRMGDR